MKVLHLIGGGDVGGAKVHVLSLVKELSKHIDVKIISLRPGVFADEAVSMGINIEIVKTGNIIGDVARVVHIIKGEGYQIIHSHGAKANVISLIAGRLTKLPTVTTVHSDYRLDYLQSLIKQYSIGLINTVSLRHINYYIGVSKNFKDMLIERKFHPDKVFTVYNGIDFEKHIGNYSREQFSSKYSINLTKDDMIVGILARLDPVKGLNVFINAAKVVLKQNPSVKFLIGGQGDEQKALQSKVKSLGIAENVFFLGWIDNPYEFMSILDINVLTSISESFPYTILEGAILKKATISSNVGGISDLIDSGKNGFLFRSGDSSSLAAYMLELINNKNLRDKMGNSLYQKASTLFSLKNMCDNQLEIYSSILDKENSRAKQHSSYDVVISGYYGFENIGDDAMLMAIINSLRVYKKNVKIIALSKTPLLTSMEYGIDSISRHNPFHIYKAMKKSRLFIYGGGNLIQDATSTRTLMYYLTTIWAAKKMGLKVMLYANGIEPLNKSISKTLTQNIINNVDVITLREELSMKELSRLHIRKPRIALTADPALSVSLESDIEAEDLLLREGISTSGPFIGFSVREWQGYEKVYGKIIAQAADYMVENYGVKPVFIPMHYPIDLYTIESVVARMKYKGYIIRNKYSLPQTMAIISRMEMLIGMRLHALIFAASMGVPIIGLVYAQKIEGFLQYINQPSAGDVRYLNIDRIKTLADDVWKNRIDISNTLKNDVQKLKQMAQESARIATELIDDAK